jgi:hypothetical protein
LARATPRRGHERTRRDRSTLCVRRADEGNQQIDPASQDACEGRFGVGWSQVSATNQEASFIVVSWDRLVDRPRFSGICRSARKLVLKSAL